MKKQMSLFVWAVAMFGMSPVFGATNTGASGASTVDLTGGPAVRVTNNINYNKYQTRSSVKPNYVEREKRSIYYSTPERRSDLYREYDSTRTISTRTNRIETTRSELKRKYFLAHPFFQPSKGKFGSVTDLSYTMASYDIDWELFKFGADVQGGKWDAKQFAVQEDISYGITDKLALMLMGKYNSTDYKFDWDDGTTDKMTDNGFNTFGAGAQWRFMDTDKWIGSAAAYYQYQKDISNNFVLDLKAGYKTSSTTIYGLLRGMYLGLEANSYGNGVTGVNSEYGQESTFFMAYKRDTNNAYYVEGGIGTFSVLGQDWTLNLEALFGHYDWHQMGTIKGAIGWQPNDWFALNLYAQTSFYDSADGKRLEFWVQGYEDYKIGEDNNNYPFWNTGWAHVGDAKIDNNSETTIGLQAIFMF